MWHAHLADQRVCAQRLDCGENLWLKDKAFIDLGEYWIGVRVLASAVRGPLVRRNCPVWIYYRSTFPGAKQEGYWTEENS
jgi:hypothetical protein